MSPRDPDFQPRRRPARWQDLAGEISDLLTFLMMAGFLFVLADANLPPQDLPWKPLRVANPIGIATRLKLEHAAAHPNLCRAVLAADGIAFRPAPDRDEGETCRVRDALTLADKLEPRGPVMACREALAFAIWEQQVVQPAAYRVFGVKVVSVRHYGTYACRTIAGRRDGAVSEHAYADALDVAGFDLADGRKITVRDGWNSPGLDGRFLHRVRDGGCRVFNAVLGPDYNSAHADHLHLDMGDWSVCS